MGCSPGAPRAGSLPGYKYCGWPTRCSRWSGTAAPRARSFPRVPRGSGHGQRLRPFPPLHSDQGIGKGGPTLQRPGPHGGVCPSRALGPELLSTRPRALRGQITLSSSSSPAKSSPAGASPALALSPPRLAEAGPGTACTQPGKRESRRGWRLPGKKAGGCAWRWRGAGPRCAPPHVVAGNPEWALASSSAQSGPRAFWQRGVRGCSAHVPSSVLPKSPEAALPGARCKGRRFQRFPTSCVRGSARAEKRG